MSVNGLFVLFGSGEPCILQRNVTTCPRVHVVSGENVVLVVPAVMPCSYAQQTAFSNQLPAGTSVNGSFVSFGSGHPAALKTLHFAHGYSRWQERT